MRGIILIAPPAAGKGTQSSLLCKKYKFAHVSTGDLLREAASKDTPEGIYIKEKMNSGELVDNELTIKLLEEKLKSIKASGFILDGFPRDLDQAKKLDQIMDEIDITRLYVFHIDVDLEIVKMRYTGRVACPSCGEIYNKFIDELKPSQEGICDKCGHELITRSDDNEKTFNKRFEVYADKTKPLIKFYNREKMLYHIDGNRSAKEINKQIVDILEGDNND